jgi:hypothetical protein
VTRAQEWDLTKGLTFLNETTKYVLFQWKYKKPELNLAKLTINNLLMAFAHSVLSMLKRDYSSTEVTWANCGVQTQPFSNIPSHTVV